MNPQDPYNDQQPQPPLPPTSVPPANPYQMPYPQQRHISVGAIVGIIIGSSVILSIIIVAIVIVAVQQADRNTDHDASSSSRLAPPDQDPEQNPAANTEYKNDRISFRYPNTMEQQDASNITVITPSGTPSDSQVFTGGDDSEVIINYSGQWSNNASPVDKAR